MRRRFDQDRLMRKSSEEEDAALPINFSPVARQRAARLLHRKDRGNFPDHSLPGTCGVPMLACGQTHSDTGHNSAKQTDVFFPQGTPQFDDPWQDVTPFRTLQPWSALIRKRLQFPCTEPESHISTKKLAICIVGILRACPRTRIPKRVCLKRRDAVATRGQTRAFLNRQGGTPNLHE